MKKLVIAAAVATVCAGSAGYGQTYIKGDFFGDYAYTVKDNEPANEDVSSFSIRRIYFTFEHSMAKNISVRFRLESKSNPFGDSGRINPFVKQAYIAWNNVIPGHTIYAGISSTNALANTDAYWAYRSVSKSMLDLNKISSSADLGVAVKGTLGKNVHHWVMVSNGTGYGSPEVDKFKKVSYSLWVTPVKGLIIEGYADYEKQDPATASLSSARDFFQASSYTTLKGLVGYKTKTFTVGAEAFMRTNAESGSIDAAGTGQADVVRQGVSLFGWTDTPVDKIRLFGRYDLFDPNNSDTVFAGSSAGIDDEYRYMIFGVDYEAAKDVHIMPNVVIHDYTLDNKKSDVVARITLFYKYTSNDLAQ